MGGIASLVVTPEGRLRLAVVGVLVATFLMYFLGERCLPNDGTGADGSVYAQVIRDLVEGNTDKRYSPYLLQRFTPCWCIAQVLKAFEIPPTNLNICGVMRTWNWAFVLIGVGAALRIGRGLNLSTDGRALLLGLMFANFAYLKMTAYYPVLWDTTAASLGLVVLAGYLTRNLALVFFGGLLAALCWPTGLMVTLPLLALFPFGRSCPSEPSEQSSTNGFRRIDLIPAVGFVGFVAYVLGNAAIWVSMDGSVAPHRIPIRVTSLRALSLVSVGLTCFLGLREPLRQVWSRLRATKRGPLLLGVAVAAAFFATYRLINGAILADYSDGSVEMTGAVYLQQLAYFSQVRPFNAVVSHLVYLGPVLLVGLLYYRSVIRAAADRGAGTAVIAAMVAAFSIDVESRRVLQLLILILPFVVRVLDERGLVRPFGWFLVATSLAASKFWLKQNVGEPERLPYALTDRYFWSQGPWMPHGVFLISATIALALGVILFVAFSRYERSEHRPSENSTRLGFRLPRIRFSVR